MYPAQSLSWVQLFETPWTAAHQSPLCKGYFSGKNTGVSRHTEQKQRRAPKPGVHQLSGIIRDPAILCHFIFFFTLKKIFSMYGKNHYITVISLQLK